MSRMTGWGRWAVAVAVMLPMVSSPAKAQITEADTGWPREIVTDSGTMIIYQPQPDRLDGITLTGRAAVSVLPKGSKEPVFGVVWFTARAQTDRDDRTVDIDQIAITNVRFTGESADQALLTRGHGEPEADAVAVHDRARPAHGEPGRGGGGTALGGQPEHHSPCHRLLECLLRRCSSTTGSRCCRRWRIPRCSAPSTRRCWCCSIRRRRPTT